MMEEGVVLGYYLSSFGIQVDPTKIAVIITMQTLDKHRDIRRFLGHASYHMRFIKEFSQLVAPLYTLLKKEAKFVWIEDCKTTF